MREYQKSKLASLAAQKGAAIRSTKWDPSEWDRPSAIALADRRLRVYRTAYKLDAWIRARPVASVGLLTVATLSIFGLFGATMF